MTKLGEFLTEKSVNKALVATKTGLSKQRMGELTLNPEAKLRAKELYLIALAVGVRPADLLEIVCHGESLPNPKAIPKAQNKRKSIRPQDLVAKGLMARYDSEMAGAAKNE